jgi:hypothetical protein
LLEILAFRIHPSVGTGPRAELIISRNMLERALRDGYAAVRGEDISISLEVFGEARLMAVEAVVQVAEPDGSRRHGPGFAQGDPPGP